jgi:hypothetical protein
MIAIESGEECALPFWENMMRIITLSVLVFWVAMTGLLVRMVYFPDHSRFVEVPPRLVLKGFLEGGATINTLHVYKKDQKLGHASVSTRRVWAGGVNQYRVYFSGVLDKGAIEMVDAPMNWRLELLLEDLDTWAGAKGQIRLGETNTVLDFEWVKSERMPRFTLKQKGQVVADDNSIQPMLGAFMGPQAAGADPVLPEGLGLAPGADVATLFQVKTLQGVMMLAGQERQAFLMELSAMEHWKAKAFFTEAGELALVDLPEGWRLVEPVIYGLVPEYPEDEDIPVPPMEQPATVPGAPPQDGLAVPDTAGGGKT